MNKVITVNLNNNAYQVEEPGYEALQKYLNTAKSSLADNPDKDEIIADLEQAIADKCASYLHTNKNVIAVAEIDAILKSMGPVESDEKDQEHAKTKTDEPKTATPKRLFKVRDGAIVEGVCNGIAAYFDVDPTMVRALFIILTVISAGTWIIVYILLAIFLPEARTREDVAHAQGIPYNAQTIIANAQKRYEYWKKFGQDQQEKWTAEHGEQIKYWTNLHNEHKKGAAGHTAKFEKEFNEEITRKMSGYNYGYKPGKFSRGLAGFIGGMSALLLCVLSLAWVIALIQFFGTGSISGYFAGVPTMVMILLLSCVFYLIFLPLQMLTGSALRFAKSAPTTRSFWGKMVAAAIWIAALIGIFSIANQVPQVRDGWWQLRNDIHQHIDR
ncbi:MAG TPA: PspC domain-containing protein [Candidatus Saccharimonas sp.]|nr:PspC domain-containing protein [Candidatus Saccharimonas sp.]